MPARLDVRPCPVPRWLPGGQVQTLYGALYAPYAPVHFVRERMETADSDFLDLDWCAPGLMPGPARGSATAPQASELARTAARRWMTPGDWPRLPTHADALLLFHGLEGDSLSAYMQAIAHDFLAQGWVVVAAHFRGCSGVPNRMARAYYSGDSDEIAALLAHARARLPGARWHAAGISLGGNALLKYLGEAGAAATGLQAAAAVSVPMDLPACGRRLSDTLLGRELYSRYFLHSIRRKILEKAQRFPGTIDPLRVHRLRTLRALDDLYTAPMHGFHNALDYWTRAASLPLLPSIRTPVLVLNARNDPFMPQTSLPGTRDAAADVLLHQPAEGGHASFVTGAFPGHLHWLPARLLEFFRHGT